MEPRNYNKDNLLKCLASLPKKMLSMHGIDNLSEFVLHDLCNKNCFDFQKAAYFIDNPDFDYLKGIAGFNSEKNFDHETSWENPKSFSDHMKQCNFNQKVRSMEMPSIKRSNKLEEELVEEICIKLGFDNSSYYCWNLKHDNHGVFIFEKPEDYNLVEEELLHALCLFGFCPVH